MRERMSDGLSAAEAARGRRRRGSGRRLVVRAAGGRRPRRPLRELGTALTSFNETRAQSRIRPSGRRAQSRVSPRRRRAAVPPRAGRGLGARGDHRRPGALREQRPSRKAARARPGLGRGGGRHALLAAPPGEQHDLGLVVLGLALRDRGWRVTFLGADTPIETIADTARRVAPEVIVVATLVPPEAAPRAAIRELARDRRVVVSGAGVSAELAGEVGAEHSGGGPARGCGLPRGLGCRIARSAMGRRARDADHRVSGHQRGQLLLAHASVPPDGAGSPGSGRLPSSRARAPRRPPGARPRTR